MQVFRDHPRARPQGGLDPRLHAQTQGGCFFRDQAGAEHDGGVGSIGARGDRGNYHGAIGHFRLLPVDNRGHLAFRVYVALRLQGVNGIRKHLFGLTQWHPVLWPLGTRQTGFDAGQIQFNHRGVVSLFLTRGAEHTLCFGIGLDQIDLFFIATGQTQVGQGFCINRENAAGRTIFRGHVGDGGTIGQRQVIQPIAEEFDEFTHDPVLAQDLDYGQDQVSGSGTFRQMTFQAEANHLWN